MSKQTEIEKMKFALARHDKTVKNNSQKLPNNISFHFIYLQTT